jgi:hypothetical protein
MNPLSALTLMPSTKSQVEAFSNSVINEVESGTLNPLDLKVQIKFLQTCLDKIDKATKDSFTSEASKYGKEFEFKGYKVTEVEAGVNYDYSNDIEWSRLSKLLKERETFLKTLKEPLEVLDSETGEITKCYPPIKRSTTTYKFIMI